MTSLSASALDLDPAGCALLEGITNPTGLTRSQPSWLRACFGFVGSTTLIIVVLVAMAS
jgi:hypothetical protein